MNHYNNSYFSSMNIGRFETTRSFKCSPTWSLIIFCPQFKCSLKFSSTQFSSVLSFSIKLLVSSFSHDITTFISSSFFPASSVVFTEVL